MPVTTKIYQGIGALPGSHKDWAFSAVLLLYYNQILGVPATAASIALAAALLIDAITDPLVGAYSDQFKSRLGRRHPFMYAAAVPIGVLGYLLFSPPADAGHGVLTAWLLVNTVLLHIAFTFFVVPWNALAAEYSDDYVERTSIIAYRHLVGWIGGVVFAFCVLTYVFASTEQHPAGQLNPDAYPVFAVVLGSLMTLWVLITTHLTRREVPYLLQPVDAASRVSVGALLRQILLSLRSRNFRLILVGHLIFAGLSGIGGVFDIYMNTYFWEFVAEDLRWFTLTICGALIGIAAAQPLQRRFEKHRILMLMLSLAAVLGMLKVILRFADVWPDNGDPSLLIALVIQGALFVLCMTIGGIMFSSMTADLVDEQELHTGLRQEGIYASSIAFSAKAVTSLGLIIGGLLLDYVIAFPKASTPGSVAGDTLFRLAFIDGIAVNLLFVVPIAMLSRYTLTRTALTDVQARLARRRGGA
ncbi:MAG: MFS transporter [Pseudomonadota bacterium]